MIIIYYYDTLALCRTCTSCILYTICTEMTIPQLHSSTYISYKILIWSHRASHLSQCQIAITNQYSMLRGLFHDLYQFVCARPAVRISKSTYPTVACIILLEGTVDRCGYSGQQKLMALLNKNYLWRLWIVSINSKHLRSSNFCAYDDSARQWLLHLLCMRVGWNCLKLYHTERQNWSNMCQYARLHQVCECSPSS